MDAIADPGAEILIVDAADVLGVTLAHQLGQVIIADLDV